MKAKGYLVIVLAGSLSVIAGIWAYYVVGGGFAKGDIFQFGIIALLIIFAVYLGIRKLISERKGQPAEDELSKRILQKAASTSFYISLYLWLVISYISDSRELPTHTWIGVGILGMALLFAGSWLYFNSTGVEDN